MFSKGPRVSKVRPQEVVARGGGPLEGGVQEQYEDN